MSEFSELLSEFIKEKNIKVYSLIKYCNLDRSTMYKFINDKRTPATMDVFNSIAEGLHLTPLEYDRLKEAYLITKTGRKTYYSRKSVEDFVVNFPNNRLSTLAPIPPASSAYPDNLLTGVPCQVLSTQVGLNYFVHQSFLAESQKPNGKIALFLQPDYDFLFSLLPGLKSAGSLRIVHTFCMSNSGQMTPTHELYCLKYLKVIFPMFLAGQDYTPYYFYDDIHSHFHNFNGLPCLILTSDYAFTCTSDYKMGIMYQDSRVISMLWDLYFSYQNKCSPLFQVVPISPENSRSFDSQLSDEYPCLVLQPEACLSPFINDKILENALNPNLPNYAELLPMIKKLFISNHSNLSNENTFIYFTKRGLMRFAKTGRIKEFPDIFYRPFTPEERIAVLEAMLPYCEDGHYRLLTKPLNQLSENLHLCTNGNLGYLMFNDISDQNIGLIIRESSLLAVFSDYLESLDDAFLLTGEETAQTVQAIITQIKPSV